ncbi:neurogenic locus notch homolog 2-like, partial [Paramuricea clavata]
MTATGCNQVSACQFHDRLCQNGGSYVPLTPTDHSTPRYKCHCLTGYTGRLCQHAIKSCRGYSNGSRVLGNYQVLDDNMKHYEVFCDFDSSLNKVWTLVSSYQLQNKVNFNEAYLKDWPVNENTPRWDKYRLSRSRMQSVQNDSSKFRVTCKYDTDGLNYTDYLEAKKEHIDVLNFKYRHVCSLVDYVNIRGDDCAFCTMILFQDPNYPLHVDSSKTDNGCDFKSTGAEKCGGPGEDNFGFYKCVNPAHRCSSSADATTQL